LAADFVSVFNADDTARGGFMGSISVEKFLESPGRLLSEAQGGEIVLVTQDGEPVFMAVPMGASLDARRVRLEVAVSLFDREQVSIGVASDIAGLAISEMIDELGRRRIPVVRYSKEEFAEELKHVRGLSDRR
jgi:predicted HTH domain antitoxin